MTSIAVKQLSNAFLSYRAWWFRRWLRWPKYFTMRYTAMVGDRRGFCFSHSRNQRSLLRSSRAASVISLQRGPCAGLSVVCVFSLTRPTNPEATVIVLTQELPQTARRLVNFRGNLGQGIELSASSATSADSYIVHVLAGDLEGTSSVGGRTPSASGGACS
jgi:hypothetical protein